MTISTAVAVARGAPIVALACALGYAGTAGQDEAATEFWPTGGQASARTCEFVFAPDAEAQPSAATYLNYLVAAYETGAAEVEAPMHNLLR